MPTDHCLSSCALAIVWGLIAATATAGGAVNESARAIPVACRVDVLVVGGSTGGVAAAVAAAESGATVFLAAERAYLGDDMTATLRLWPQADDELDTPLARQLFADPQRKPVRQEGPVESQAGHVDLLPPRPMHVKKTLDEALLAAGVDYLYGCFPTDVLRDARGRPCGIAMANRAGRQAVVAKVIIDATQRATVARLAGARFRPFPPGRQTMQFTVIGGAMHPGRDVAARIAAPPYRGPFPNRAKTSSGDFQLIEYTVQVPMAGDTEAAWAAAEQLVRSKTYDPEQQFTADSLYQVPPDAVHGRQTDAGPWRGSKYVPLDALRPEGMPAVYVLGGCADVSRGAAARLMRPGTLIAVGRRVGREASQQAAVEPAPSGVHLPGTAAVRPAVECEVREVLDGVRPARTWPTIRQDARALPVLGHYDVVVVGGGTSGAPAAIAAARQGARTLVVEQYHGLGGQGTLGTVACYFQGNRCGFTATVPEESWVIEQRMQWWRTEVLQAGGHIWFGSLGCGALVREGRVCGVVVATPRGRGAVLAKTVVDTTGNADIAAAAGAKCLYTDHCDFSLLGAGVPPRHLGATVGGADFCIVDETDMVDVWHLYVYAKQKHARAFDQGPIIASRERRRIWGEHTLSLVDELNGRTYADTIAVAESTFDCGPTGGYTLGAIFLAGVHPGQHRIDIPYRCCLPKRLEGIFVAALGLSAEHDALPMIRMQPDLQNLGYAVGVAAAMTARSGKPARQIDVRALQRHLVEIGNLRERVLTDTDSPPPAPATVAEAVRHLHDDPQNATVILAHPKEALPRLREAYAGSRGPARQAYAQMLAILGDPRGVDTLIAAVRGFSAWDQGWNYRRWRRDADGRFRLVEPGPLLSRLDRLILALGRAGDRRAVPAIVEKLQQLTDEDDFSHHRSVALALESLADPATAQPLAELLARPGMAGHTHPSIEVALKRQRPGPGRNNVECRQNSLRELMLARALYRCGDYQGIGEKTLHGYAEDLRGHLSRHARAVLEHSPP